MESVRIETVFWPAFTAALKFVIIKYVDVPGAITDSFRRSWATPDAAQKLTSTVTNANKFP